MTDRAALSRLAARLVAARDRQLATLAADQGEGLPDLRQLDTLATLHAALAAVSDELEDAGGGAHVPCNGG